MAEDERRISEAEFDLLEALWKRRRATARDLAADMQASRGWARTTVKTMLDRMAAKELVSMRRVGNVQEYEPKVEEQEARRTAWRRFLEHAFNGAVAPALQFIANDAKLTAKQKEALRRLLEEDDHE
jgi:BlaI family transcriptional regulator, penicillinase repressor